MACWHSFFCSSCIVTASASLALGRVSHRWENKLPGSCMALRRVKPLSRPAGCGKPSSWVMGTSPAPRSPAPHGSAARVMLAAAALVLGIELYPAWESVCVFSFFFFFFNSVRGGGKAKLHEVFLPGGKNLQQTRQNKINK